MFESLLTQRPKGSKPFVFIYWIVLAISQYIPGWQFHFARSTHNALYLNKAIDALLFALLTLFLFWAKPLKAARAFWHQLIATSLIIGSYVYFSAFLQRYLSHHRVSSSSLLFNLLGVLAMVLWLGKWPRAKNLPSIQSFIIARITLVLLVPALLLMSLGLHYSFDLALPWPMGPHYANRYEPRMDHLLHLIVNVFVILLITAAKPFGANKTKRTFAFTALLLASLGPVLEMIQFRIGRGFEYGDIIADEIGVWIAFCIGLGLWASLPKRHINEDNASAQTPSLMATPPQVADVPTDAQATTSDTALSSPKDLSADFIKHARTVSSLTLISRVTGLVRDTVLAAMLGLTGTASAFFIGFLVPNLFRRLFGEGALTAAFIPVYSDLLHKDRRMATRLASVCLSAMAIGLALLTLLGEWFLHTLGQVGQWDDTTLQAIHLMMLMLPYMPLICLVAMLGGILQVHGKFGSTASTPIVLNICMVSGALIGWSFFKEGSTRTSLPDQSINIIALSVVLAGILQLLWQLFSLLGHERWGLGFSGVKPHVKRMMVSFLPMAFGLAVFQINAFVDSLIAFGLSHTGSGPEYMMVYGKRLYYPMDDWSVAALNWSQRLYQFPLGVFGIAIATAIFPALSRAAAEHGQQSNKPNNHQSNTQFATILQQGLKLTVFIGLPASIGLILVRVPLTRLIFQYGKFTVVDAYRVSYVLAGYAVAIWAYSMTHVLTRGFYALKDAKTPLKISLSTVLLNISLNFVAIWYLGAAGLAWSTALCAIWQCSLLLRAMTGYVPHVVNAQVRRSWLKTSIATSIMAIALLPIYSAINMTQIPRSFSAMILVLMLILGISIYGFIAKATGSPELAWLLHRRHQGTLPHE